MLCMYIYDCQLRKAGADLVPGATKEGASASVTLYSAQVPVRAATPPDQTSSGKAQGQIILLSWWYAGSHM